jgi:hypothetical protein
MTEMSDEDPAAVLARIAGQSRARLKYDFRKKELWSDSFIARIKECENLAEKTIYPEMAEMMRKLAGLWREMASSPPKSGHRQSANCGEANDPGQTEGCD